MSPHRPAHRRPVVLFEPTADGWTTRGEIPVNPREVACPVCHARPRRPCTVRVRRAPGWRELTGHHDTRIRLAADSAATAAAPEAPDSAADSPAAARTHPPTGASTPERAETISGPKID